MKSQAENISRQLRGWANALQESPITGQRYLTEKARRVSRARQDREEFLKELERMRASSVQPSANPNPASGSIPPKD